jgi:hypothetical protein
VTSSEQHLGPKYRRCTRVFFAKRSRGGANLLSLFPGAPRLLLKGEREEPTAGKQSRAVLEAGAARVKTVTKASLNREKSLLMEKSRRPDSNRDPFITKVERFLRWTRVPTRAHAGVPVLYPHTSGEGLRRRRDRGREAPPGRSG